MHIGIPAIDMAQLIERYDALLFDAYGVLVHGDGPLPGASELLTRLRQEQKPFFIVTNSAARLPEDAADRYQRLGLPIEPEHIVSSGSLLQPWFAAAGLQGARCAILGPVGTFQYVEQAGATAVAPTEDFDALVIGDQVGFPFLDGMDAALSRLIEKFDRGETPPLILPNPDLIYPKAAGFGLTCGAMATIIESVLAQRYPGRAGTHFIHLGKPEAAIFAEAVQRAGTCNVVMIGDQLDTDIRGACRFGIDSALVDGGVSGWASLEQARDCLPTYRLRGL
jgi:HAD superfamily hydrolase (TIGR01450 family)